MDNIMIIKNKIDCQLFSLIDDDYIYLDLPYYTNVGDILIWKGAEEFLRQKPYRCLYRASIETYVKQKISKSVIVLLHGGGNFGDLWRRHLEFTLRIIKEYPENRVIILPQTVYYKNSDLIASDAEIFSRHKNLTICARDHNSYELLNKHFSKNKIILVPDMAFYISSDLLEKYSQKESNKALFFKRKDREYLEYDYEKWIDNGVVLEEHEWPSIEKEYMVMKILSILIFFNNLFVKNIPHFRFVLRFVDWYAYKIFMPILLADGIRFMSGYKYVYTTRLHGAILAVLLKKTVVFFDNSYGKNAVVYNAWLRDFDNIRFTESQRGEASML
jgi:pyruvyl transferase EpsO